MKKLFITAMLAVATFSFANTPEIKSVEKTSSVTTKVSDPFIYEVSFPLPCGGHTITVYFASSNTGIAFIGDLANALNSAVAQGCQKVAEFGF